MRTLFFATVFFGVGITVVPAVFAVGSGSGGSFTEPSCSADTWNCGDWSACSAGGRQTRACSLSFDCAAVITPRPIEDQACVPSPVTVTTASPQPARPACTADIWQCGAWSSCDTDGNESRSCAVSVDCLTASTPSPMVKRQCAQLQCGTKASVRERVRCRLGLAPAGIARELQIQYLPEECRFMEDGADRTACIARYKSYKPCWAVPAGEDRFACARGILKLDSVESEMKKCAAAADAAACMASAREKAFSMIKFRFYDLEKRAEDFLKEGADVDAVADFVTAVQLAKRDFNAASTNAVRREIILRVRAAWREFLNITQNQIQ